MKKILAGILFAILWGSGSVPIKMGAHVVQPLVFLDFRFILAALIMLSVSYLFSKSPMPTKEEWKPLIIGGLISMTIYPCVYIYAMKNATAGIGALASATSPLIITLLNTHWLSRKITANVWQGLLIGLFGVAIAIYPLLHTAHASVYGIALLLASMILYSFATVYYQSIEWKLPRLSINGWQVLVGSVALFPFTFYNYDDAQNNYGQTFYISIIWIVILVTIIAVQLWLYLLKEEPTKASLWLYLCPIFGFIASSIFTGEPITIYTFIGTLFVLLGLYLGKREA